MRRIFKIRYIQVNYKDGFNVPLRSGNNVISLKYGDVFSYEIKSDYDHTSDCYLWYVNGKDSHLSPETLNANIPRIFIDITNQVLRKKKLKRILK